MFHLHCDFVERIKSGVVLMCVPFVEKVCGDAGHSPCSPTAPGPHYFEGKHPSLFPHFRWMGSSLTMCTASQLSSEECSDMSINSSPLLPFCSHSNEQILQQHFVSLSDLRNPFLSFIRRCLPSRQQRARSRLLLRNGQLQFLSVSSAPGGWRV